ncbi:IclR family transcriptional regulator [Streptomyces sp. NBC_01537]|uniref:IclR family transcriptional regulator n=1 Tax=Streptomyces sp. NBC_01537 TaxID=2903896 RepID=UPI003865E62D
MSQPDPAATAAAAAAADRRNASSSLRRALSILMFLAEDGGHPVGVTLTELATGLGLSKSTVLRLAAPLREARLVDQDAESGRYRLGPQNALLGQVYLERLDVRRVASPLLQQLAEEVGETVHLLTFDAPEIVYIDKVESPQPVRMHSRIGSRQPAYCTATGKAFLAHATEDVVDLVIAAGMPARTEYTITSPDRLRADLALIRQRGYAIDDIENEHDIRCAAAPVFDHAGVVTTAVSVSGPASRITHERLPGIGALLTAATKAITEQLGGSVPPLG